MDIVYTVVIEVHSNILRIMNIVRCMYPLSEVNYYIYNSIILGCMGATTAHSSHAWSIALHVTVLAMLDS